MTAPAGGYLVGFECGLTPWFDVETVAALRPLFRTARGVIAGREIAPFADRRVNGRVEKTKVTRTVRLEAREGYAVSGVSARFGLSCDRLSLVFARVANDRLDLTDSYTSQWAGTSQGGGPVSLDGKGGVPIGVAGFADTSVYGLRLLLTPVPRPPDPVGNVAAAAKPAAPDDAPPLPKDAEAGPNLVPVGIGLAVALVVGTVLVLANKSSSDSKLPAPADDIVPGPTDGRRFSTAVADPAEHSAPPTSPDAGRPDTSQPQRFHGQGYSGLPAEMAVRVRDELTPGEAVVWTGQPSHRVTLLNVLRGALVAVIPSVVVGILVVVFLVPKGNPPNAGGVATVSLFIVLAASVCGPLPSAFVAYHRGAKTCYVLTNRRAIVWVPGFFGEGEFDSYTVAVLQLMRRRDSWFVPEAGDLVFRTQTIVHVWSDGRQSHRSAQVTRYGFLGIDDVRSVEKLIRHTLINPVA